MAAASDLEKMVTEGLDVDSDIVSLGRMIATKSLHRNLKTEDAAVKRDYEAGYTIASGGQSDGGEDMDIMVAHGDVHIYERAKDAKQSSSPVQQAPGNPTTGTTANPSQPSGLSTLAKAALVAAAIGGPIAGGLTGYFLSKPGTTTTIENPADGTGIGLVPPAKPKQIDP